MFFPQEFKSKKILIFGYGKTGKSVQKYFKKNKINYKIWDDNKKLKTKKIDKKYYLKKYDYIILSPGINIYNHKKKVFFQEHKKKIITDLDIFFLSKKKFKHVIGVTGTNGKSSFCNLLNNLIKKNNIKSKILGNFGNPVLSENISKNEYCILELSSYQLDYSKYLKLDTACILNISPDHLERHGTIENYKKIKLKIFKFLNKRGVGFYDKKSLPSLKMSNNIKSFSSINKKLLQTILGKKILLTNLDLNNNKLEHRYESFCKIKNFNFINDSKSTNFDSTRYALKMSSNNILILGGQLKMGDNFFLKDLRKKIVKIYLFGKNNSALELSLRKQKIKFTNFIDLKSLLKHLLINDFKKLLDKRKNFTILFSPGTASFDQFKNFQHRGKTFKNYVYKFFKR
tara:strand:- start:2142 stop:3341 length:1200 start_codon:yes stop_codon:yes gene_type:complete